MLLADRLFSKFHSCPQSFTSQPTVHFQSIYQLQTLYPLIYQRPEEVYLLIDNNIWCWQRYPKSIDYMFYHFFLKHFCNVCYFVFCLSMPISSWGKCSNSQLWYHTPVASAYWQPWILPSKSKSKGCLWAISSVDFII